MFRLSLPAGPAFSACSVVVLTLALAACSNGRAVQTAQEATPPVAEAQVAPREAANELQMEVMEVSSDTPKRNVADPIYVNLSTPALDGRLRQADKPKGVIWQQIRAEFVADPIIQLMPSSNSKVGRKASQNMPRTADVEVLSAVSLQDIPGINTNAGKGTKTTKIVFEAQVISKSPPAIYSVSESGPVQQKLAVSKRFAKQIREVIVEKIGPEMPAR